MFVILRTRVKIYFALLSVAFATFADTSRLFLRPSSRAPVALVGASNSLAAVRVLQQHTLLTLPGGAVCGFQVRQYFANDHRVFNAGYYPHWTTSSQCDSLRFYRSTVYAPVQDRS